MVLNRESTSSTKCSKTGHRIKLSKTETMIWKRNESHDDTDTESIINIQHVELENRRHFIYLGAITNFVVEKASPHII